MGIMMWELTLSRDQLCKAKEKSRLESRSHKLYYAAAGKINYGENSLNRSYWNLRF